MSLKITSASIQFGFLFLEKMNKVKVLLFLVFLTSILTVMKAVAEGGENNPKKAVRALEDTKDDAQKNVQGTVKNENLVCEFIKGYLIEGLNFDDSNILLPNLTEYAPIPAIILRRVRQPPHPVTELLSLLTVKTGFKEESEEENFVKRENKETIVASYVYEGDVYREWCPFDSEEPCIVKVVYKGPSLSISFDVKGKAYVINRSQYHTHKDTLTAQIYFTYKDALTTQIYFNNTLLDFSGCF